MRDPTPFQEAPARKRPPLPPALRLGLQFAPEGLARDLARLQASPWTPHFNTDLYHGDWSGLALRAPAGARHAVEVLHNAPGLTDFADLPVLARCPHFKAVVDALACEVSAVRLLRLAPGARIAEHRDHDLGHAFGEVRLHLPIVTNAAVDFRVAGARVIMRPGELWYIDASEPHAVRNDGAAARVHLVVDCHLNDWLEAQLQAAEPAPAAAESAHAPAVSEAMAGWPRVSHEPDDITPRILAFLRRIGVRVSTEDLPGKSFLPGIEIEAGGLRVDPSRLRYPGDLLHEAGHLAVLPPDQRCQQGAEVSNDPAQEMMAIAWSWAALTHLALSPEVVFHADGYKGDAQWLIDTYSSGTFIALPMLQWIGLSADPSHAEALGIAPYPHMIRWLREEDATHDAIDH